jgi:uncharacterized protein
MTFQSFTHGPVELDNIISIIKTFLEDEPDAQYSLVIGTDSHEKNDREDFLNGNGHSKALNGHGEKNGFRKGISKKINLVTAVLIHRKGFGGKYFWVRRETPNIHSLREKIYAETLASLNFATTFVPLLKKSLNGKSPNYNLEIHVDVGEHGDTRDMIKEVVGMVTGNGFVAKTKPEAYGASYVADKHT